MSFARSGALVDREQQLDELRAALARAEAGRGSLTLIVGEPGIGKTALADEFARAAVEHGAAVAWGRAWEAGGAPPFWPWIEVVRGLSLDGRAQVDDERVRTSLSVVAELVPELLDQVPGLPPPPELEPAQARFRLYEAITALLRWASRRRPVVVVLDDLHAADPATLSLLRFASRGVHRTRVVLLGTFRDVEARLSPAVADELSRVAREGRYLRLGRLGREAVNLWLESLAVAAPNTVIEQLYERSEGNPLFLVEMVRLLHAGSLPGEATAALPDGVREVIRARLRALPPECIETLEVCAAFGRTIDLRALAASCGVSLTEVRSRLDGALRAEVLSPLDDERVVFTHILIRDVLHDALSPERRAELHEKIAQSLIQNSSSAALAEVVYHLFEALPRIGPSEPIRWARRAARASLEQLAFEEAVAFLERALEALPPDAHAAERCDVLLELSGARIGAGNGKRGREAALAAAELARRLGDSRRLARAALRYGEVFTYATVSTTLVDLLEEALAAVGEGDEETRARLLGRLASAKQPAADPTEPMAIARRAIAMARNLPDADAQLAVLQSATSALLYFAEPEERIALDHEMLDLAARRGDRLRTLRGHLRLVFDYLEHGDAARADACIDAYEALARDIGHPTYLWYAPLVRATRAAMRGAFAEAEQLVERSQALADRSEEPNRKMTFAFHRLCLLLTAARDGALAEEGPALLQVIAERTDPWISGPLRAMIAARFGQPEPARAALGAYDADLTQARGRMAAGWIAQAAVSLGDRALCERAVERLLPLSARNHCLGIAGCFCLSPLAHPLGVATAFLERWDDAVRHFDDALSRVDAIGSPPMRAQIELDYALSLLRRGGTGDRERARRLLDAARSTADDLGLAAISDACAQAYEETAPAVLERPTAIGVPRAFAFELERDGEGWAVTCAGQKFQLEDSRGLQIIGELVSRPDEEIHVTDLLAPRGEAGFVEDAGELLDSAAVASYRRRLHELEEELDEAERWNDAARAERLRAEAEYLKAELSRAVGLGGRRRRAASSSERARINVRRRIVHALRKIEEQSPELSQHLRWAIKTGHFCAYYPAGPPR